MVTAAPSGEHVFATLLLSDSYLPGALVLAHSLRDAGTANKLAVLVTLDAVSADAITQLKTVYDYVLPVPRIRNEQPANLYLMNRGDLHSAFTKINLWRQTQFSKIVYIDADVVAYRAPDELFDLPHAFAAAPDIGWPDLFNTGVMVLTPDLGEYYAMLAMAERGISFDGADQGLLNMHFGRGFHRLSFTYNVTPSAHYQYIPAYRHFQSTINMVHFIGTDKPWLAGRNAPHGNTPFDEMVGRWWAVYDRHYRIQEIPPQQAQRPSSDLVRYFTKGEFHPEPVVTQPRPSPQQVHRESREAATVPYSQITVTEPSRHTPASAVAAQLPPSTDTAVHAMPSTDARARPEQHAPHPGATQSKNDPTLAMMHSWDAQRQPPPRDSKPEAMNFPSTHYEMSRDTKHFVPPKRYPSPPKNMWYEVPKQGPPPPTDLPRAIFPWEKEQPTPSRSFAMEEPEVPISTQESAEEPSESSATETQGEPQTPTTPIVSVTPSDPWTSFPRLNAWDDVPEISRYVEGIQQKHRRVRSQGAAGASPAGLRSPTDPRVTGRDRGKPTTLRLTDFPSEVERPSLPVTPAPIHRPSFLGDDAELGEGDAGAIHLPAAEGVPPQTEWDPARQLQKLAKQQSEVLLRKLGGDGHGLEGAASREMPSRPLPFGSEMTKPPAHVAEPARPHVLSPQPIKKQESMAGLVRSMDEADESLDPATTSPSRLSTGEEQGNDSETGSNDG